MKLLAERRERQESRANCDLLPLPDIRAGSDRVAILSDVHTMAERVAASIGQSRLTSTLLAGLSALAVLIAALGIYGVVSYGAVATIACVVPAGRASRVDPSVALRAD